MLYETETGVSGGGGEGVAGRVGKVLRDMGRYGVFVMKKESRHQGIKSQIEGSWDQQYP